MDRLAQLRARPQYVQLSDDLLETKLEEALQDFLVYTNRTKDPGEEVDSLIIEMAAIKLNMLGAEGSSSMSEQGMSRTWDSLPISLRALLDNKRKAVWP